MSSGLLLTIRKGRRGGQRVGVAYEKVSEWWAVSRGCLRKGVGVVSSESLMPSGMSDDIDLRLDVDAELLEYIATYSLAEGDNLFWGGSTEID